MIKWKRVAKSFVVTLILAGAVVGGIGIYRVYKDRQDEKAQESAVVAVRRTNIVLAKVRTMEFQQVLVLQGNVQTKRLAMVSPRIPGVLEAIFVDEGDDVIAGKTDLFRTDSLKLVRAVEIAEQGIAIADSTVREKEASLETKQVDHSQAQADVRRYRTLRKEGAATARQLEDQESRARKAAAMVEHGQALVALAKAEQQRARASLQMAEKDQADSLAKAPISGRVSKRLQEPGEMGAPGKPVLRIEDLSLVEISVFLPAKVYGQIEEKKTKMHVTVNEVDLGEQSVSYKSPTVHSKLRTFEVRCEVKTPPAAVAPGAMANVRITLRRRNSLGLTSDAIQRRGDKTVIFVVRDQAAKMIPVTVGLDTNGMTEVTSDVLKDGDEIVAMGGFLLNDGSPVRVLREEK